MFVFALPPPFFLGAVSGSLFFLRSCLSVHYGLSLCVGLQALFYFFAGVLCGAKNKNVLANALAFVAMSFEFTENFLMAF